jgi:diguanylate cyclase (GGDEF)-like protein
MAAGLAGAILLGVLGLGAWALTRHSFALLERDEARQDLVRAHRALDVQLHQLEQAAVAYAALWDETQARHSFTRGELDRLGVDTVWLAGSAGETLWQVATDDASAGTLRLIPPETLARLAESFPPTGDEEPGGQRTGLLSTPRGILLVAAAPIPHGELPATGAGRLVFGRALDSAVLSQLGEASQSQLTLTVLDGQGGSAGVVSAPLAAWLAAGARGEAPWAGSPPTAQAVLRSLDGRPLALISSVPARAALAAARRTSTAVVAVLLAGCTLLAAGLLFMLASATRERSRARRERLEQGRALSRLTRRDSLTGLPNRAHLDRLLPQLLLRAGRDGSQLALLHVDLDHFKHVNGCLGHTGGDRLLKAVAQRVRAALPRQDVVVRMGGDELVVVAGLSPLPAAARAIAGTIRAALAEPLTIDGVTLTLSSSIGISVYPTDGTDSEQLLKHADIALHHAKDRGRGIDQFYTPDMNAAHEQLWLERALRQALACDELSIEYQPCFDLTTLRPVSLEALLRWRCPDGSFIPPSRFIPVAEQSNLIVEIGEWVLARVCQQLADWQREQVPLVPVSVNISARQFERTALASLTSGLARELGIDANLLHFEITETTAMQSSEDHLGLLQALRNLGSRILIDDFGTGYSSLSYLKKLPVDTLKIDRAFVRDMASDASDAAIVRAIVEVARSLGLMLVAEGIESAEQLEQLRGLGCQCGQGFYFSPAVPAEGCCALLRQLRGPRPEAPPAVMPRGELESHPA